MRAKKNCCLSLAIEWMENENKSIDILETKQTARSTEVAVKLLICLVRRCFIIQAEREFYELKIKCVFPPNLLSLRRNNK